MFKTILNGFFCALQPDDQVLPHHAPPAPPASTAAAQPQSTASRSLLPKASQSGLRAPGYSSSRIPAGRLAAFGFVRSSSVSSVSSAHSADSTQSDPCRTAQRESTQNRNKNVNDLNPPEVLLAALLHKHHLYHCIMSTLSSHCKNSYLFYYLLLCIPLMIAVYINSPLPHSLRHALLSLLSSTPPKMYSSPCFFFF